MRIRAIEEISCPFRSAASRRLPKALLSLSALGALLLCLLFAALALHARHQAEASLLSAAAAKADLASSLLLRSAPASFWIATPDPSASAHAALSRAASALLPSLGVRSASVLAQDGSLLHAPDPSRVGSRPAPAPDLPRLPLAPWAESPFELPVPAEFPFPSLQAPLPESSAPPVSLRAEFDLSAEAERARSSLSAAWLSLASLWLGSLLLLGLPLLLSLRGLGEAHAALESASSLDPATGALAREHALCRLSQEHARASRGLSEHLAVLLLDLDQLPNIALAYGEGASEASILEVSSRLFHCARGYDVIGRYRQAGEFLLLFPGASPADALLIAERIRSSVCDKPVPFGDLSIRATVSVGVSSFRRDRDGETPEALLERAARALQAARDRGGDACVAL